MREIDSFCPLMVSPLKPQTQDANSYTESFRWFFDEFESEKMLKEGGYEFWAYNLKKKKRLQMVP